jgi:glycosyltransferase involved in cell wall biosynthesis
VSKYKRYFRNRIRQITSYFTDTIVVVCNSTGKFVYDEWNVSPKKIRLIYNGVDLNTFNYHTKRKYSKRIELGYSEDDIIVGTLVHLQKLKTIIRLYKRFQEWLNISLYIY